MKHWKETAEILGRVVQLAEAGQRAAVAAPGRKVTGTATVFVLAAAVTLGPLFAQPRSSGGPTAAPGKRRPDRVTLLATNPAVFLENVGQFDSRVRFRAHGVHGSVDFAPDAIWLQFLASPVAAADDRSEATADDEPLSRLSVRLGFLGANPRPRMEGFSRLETRVSFLLGSDPSRWHPNVPAWSGVRYADLYPGVDLEVHGRDGGWAWRLLVRRPESLAAVRLSVDGADRLALESGQLRIGTSLGEFSLPLLEIAGQELAFPLVAGPTRIEGKVVEAPFSGSLLTSTFAAASGLRPIHFSVLLGGDLGERANGVSIDHASKAVYVTGRTESLTWVEESPGAIIPGFHGGANDVFVTKRNPDGSIAYVTYLGGSGDDQGFDIAVDSATGEVYVTGRTNSPDDFQTPGGAFQRSGGDYDAFLIRLAASGDAIRYGTYLGGASVDYGYAVALGSSDRVYLTGVTASDGFPRKAQRLQPLLDDTFEGGHEAFLVQFDTTRTGADSLVYSTFLGGRFADQGHDLELDPLGIRLFLVGQTLSDDLPQALAVRRSAEGYSMRHSGAWDVFLIALDPSNFSLWYFTYLGGARDDCEVTGDFRECRVAAVSHREVYVSGTTASSGAPGSPEAFPTTRRAYGRQHRGGTAFGTDVFLAKIDPWANGRRSLVYSTLLGGTGDDFGFGLAVGAKEEPYVVGRTQSCDFPTSGLAFRSFFQGTDEGFLARFNASGSFLLYSTLLGGSDVDRIISVALDEPTAYVAGSTQSADFPSSGRTRTLLGSSDGFLASLDAPFGSGPTFRLDPRSESHLFWPFRASTYESPCVMDDNAQQCALRFVCWGIQLGSVCHVAEDAHAQDWRMYNFGEPEGAQVCQTAGQPFLSPVDGKVLFAGPAPLAGYGNQITIQVHDFGAPTNAAIRIAHFQDNSLAVSTGDIVSRGDVLARVGNTGPNAGPVHHAHIALYKDLEEIHRTRLKTGGTLYGTFSCDGVTPATENAAPFVLDAVRSAAVVEYLFESECDFGRGLVGNSGLIQDALRGRISRPDLASPVPRAGGMALKLDGDFAYVEIENSATLTGSDLGIEAFVWRESNDDEDPIISRGGQWALTFLTDGNGKLVFSAGLPGNRVATAEYPLPDDYLQKWNHVAVTFSPSGGIQLYWNGEKAGDPVRAPGLAWRTDEPILIGSAGPNRSLFHGGIDSVRIWGLRLPICQDC